MAEKRMFAKSIVLSDAFLDMPMSTRCLYFTLSMLADDDGFVGNPKSIMRQCGASQDDMIALIQKRYVLAFESGVIVIKHWRINNYLQNDRHKPTTYVEEMAILTIDEKGAYTELNKSMYTDCIQNVSKMDTQNSIDKNSIDKNSIDKYIVEIVDYLNLVCHTNYRAKTPKTQKHINARLSEGFTVDDFKMVIDKKSNEWLGTSMEQYLRPDTLFGTKFESYLNQNIVKQVYKQSANAPIDWSKV